MALHQSNKLKHNPKGRVRIVSGQYRGRVLHFPALKMLRPTPLRMRETLFNWLAGEVQGRRCLDLFAGSGALGFECASRGAAQVTLVDSHPQVVRALRASARALKTGEHLRIVKANAETFMRRTAAAGERFDLIFADPPFGKIAQDELARMIAGLIRPGGRLYMEAEGRTSPPPDCPGFTLLKETRVGDVRGRLFGYHFEPDS